MASEKQIEANRNNALKSTGPRTPEGKAKSRLNARRDGITGQVVTLSEEDRPVFDKLKAELLADLAPMTVMELKLAHAIAWDTWRLDRIRAIETNMYALGATENPVTVEDGSPALETALSDAATWQCESHRFALLSVYEQRLNHSLHKNLAVLRAMQAERKQHYKRDLAEEVLLARSCDIKGQPYNAPVVPTINGSVFETGDVFAAANRETTLQAAGAAVISVPQRIQFGDKPGSSGPGNATKTAKAA